LIEFNFVPANLRNRSRTAINWLRVGTIFAVALTIVVVAGSFMNQMSIAMYRRELAAQRPGIQRVDDLERQLRDIRRENQRLTAEVSRLQALGDGEQTERFLDFLNALSATASEGILLDALEYSKGGATRVAGVAIDPEELSHFFDQVKQIPGVIDASLTSMGRPAGEESGLRRFELRIQWRTGG